MNFVSHYVTRLEEKLAAAEQRATAAEAGAAAMRKALEYYALSSHHKSMHGPHDLGARAREVLASTDAGAELLARVKRMRAYIERIGHRPDCACDPNPQCQCGYDAALSGADAGRPDLTCGNCPHARHAPEPCKEPRCTCICRITDAGRAGAEEAPRPWEMRVDLWEAINAYVTSCGGDPAGRAYGNVSRMNAVAQVEQAVDALLAKCSDAYKARLAVADETREVAVRRARTWKRTAALFWRQANRHAYVTCDDFAARLAEERDQRLANLTAARHLSAEVSRLEHELSLARGAYERMLADRTAERKARAPLTDPEIVALDERAARVFEADDHDELDALAHDAMGALLREHAARTEIQAAWEFVTREHGIAVQQLQEARGQIKTMLVQGQKLTDEHEVALRALDAERARSEARGAQLTQVLEAVGRAVFPDLNADPGRVTYPCPETAVREIDSFAATIADLRAKLAAADEMLTKIGAASNEFFNGGKPTLARALDALQKVASALPERRYR